MIAYICTCGYVGFAETDDFVNPKVLCERCGDDASNFHGFGEVVMNNEEKIQEFMNAVRLEKEDDGP